MTQTPEGVVYRKILVGADGSERSRRATAAAATLARALGARITVAAVASAHEDALTPWSEAAPRRPVPLELAEQWARDEVAWLAEQGLVAGMVVLEGEPALALAKEAVAGGYDLLAIGRRGSDAGVAPRTGSVATRLVDVVETPLLVVP